MWEKFDEIKKLFESIAVDLHWNMLSVEYDAVLVIVYIRGVLESPRVILNCDRDDSVVLTSRMIKASCISFVFHTELTFWIGRGFCFSCCCNRFWIFLWFGKIDRNVNFSIRAVHFPFLILLYTITANIVAVLAQFVKIICCFLRIILVFFPKSLLDL